MAAQRTLLAMDWDDQRGTRREHQNLQHIMNKWWCLKEEDLKTQFREEEGL